MYARHLETPLKARPPKFGSRITPTRGRLDCLTHGQAQGSRFGRGNRGALLQRDEKCHTCHKGNLRDGDLTSGLHVLLAD